MSDIGGSYNFGVWNPPTGMDSVRYSNQLNFRLLTKLNNLQVGKEMGISQFHGKGLQQFNDYDIELIHSLNNMSLNLFNSMMYQGWIPLLTSSTSSFSVIDKNSYPANPVMPSNLSAKLPSFFFLK